MEPLTSSSLQSIRAAAARLSGTAARTPLLRVPLDDELRVPARLHVKLENLQPIGSFKLRGACNALAQTSPGQLRRGVYTASAGNMAQGVAWAARRLGVGARAVVPRGAPRAKLEAIRRLGGEILEVSFEEWWSVMTSHEHPALEGHFVHPVCDARVIAGNGTIGLELLEDLPDVDAVVVPFGGGGLAAGIASAVHALSPRTRVYACEVEAAAPLDGALRAGRPVEVEHRRTFVDGIGAASVLPAMWPLVSELLDGSIVVPLQDVASAIRLLAEHCHVIAEGAGAVSVAAALSGRAGAGNVVCVVSGGNMDAGPLARILAGEAP